MSKKIKTRFSNVIVCMLAFVMVLGLFPVTASAVTPVALPTASTVLVNGENVAFDAYNINDNNYFKLRDLAFVLNGTEKQFEVGYDTATRAITLTSGEPYTPDGSEMKSKGDGIKTPTPTTSKVYLDGEEVQFTAYNIEGNNYFKLRDVGQAFDFGVEWDGTKQTIVIETSKGYTPEILTAAQWKQIYLTEMQAAIAYAASVADDDDAWSKHDWRGRYSFLLEAFMLADLNFDGVPELIILGDGVSASSSMRIFTIYNGKAEMIFHDWGNEFTLYRKISDGSLAYMFYSGNSSDIDYWASIYLTDKSTPMDSRFSESAYVAEKSGALDDDYEFSETESTWSFGGKEVSHSEYDRLMDELQAGYQVVEYQPVMLRKSWDSTPSANELQAFLNSYVPEG